MANDMVLTAPSAKALLAYFQTNDMLLCNESKDLPYLELVGDDRKGIVALIESGQAFYSKLCKRRVTYLSRACYEREKSARQRLDKVSPTARMIFDFLEANGKATTAEIKHGLMLSPKAFSKGMDELFCELLATALERDRTLDESWCSFY